MATYTINLNNALNDTPGLHGYNIVNNTSINIVIMIVVVNGLANAEFIDDAENPPVYMLDIDDPISHVIILI